MAAVPMAATGYATGLSVCLSVISGDIGLGAGHDRKYNADVTFSLAKGRRVLVLEIKTTVLK